MQRIEATTAVGTSVRIDITTGERRCVVCLLLLLKVSWIREEVSEAGEFPACLS